MHISQFDSTKMGDNSITNGFREVLERQFNEFQSLMSITLEAYHLCLVHYSEQMQASLQGNRFLSSGVFTKHHQNIKGSAISQVWKPMWNSWILVCWVFPFWIYIIYFFRNSSDQHLVIMDLNSKFRRKLRGILMRNSRSMKNKMRKIVKVLEYVCETMKSFKDELNKTIVVIERCSHDRLELNCTMKIWSKMLQTISKWNQIVYHAL